MLRPYAIAAGSGLGRLSLPLPPLPLRLDVQPRQVAAVVVEEAELALSRGAVAVGDLLGRKLPVDPPHHALPRHALHLTGAGPIGEAIERVERGVARRQLGGQSDCRTDGQECQEQRGAYLTSLAHSVRASDGPTVRRIHAVILTHGPVEKLRL